MPSRQPLVVVVEDDADMSQAMESVLRAAGFEAAMFSSAEAVLEAGIPADTTCLLLDVHLPGMTGFELYDRLNAIHPSHPVIFMTAYDEPSARARSGRRARCSGAVASGKSGRVSHQALCRQETNRDRRPGDSSGSDGQSQMTFVPVQQKLADFPTIGRAKEVA